MADENNLIQQWIKKAEDDLTAAEFLIKAENILTSIVCFHCQQSAEKFIKAYLVQLNIEFGNSHDLDYLLGLIEKRNDFESGLYNLIDKFENFAVELRYPNQKFEPTVEETKTAFEASIKVKSIILSKIK